MKSMNTSTGPNVTSVEQFILVKFVADASVIVTLLFSVGEISFVVAFASLSLVSTNSAKESVSIFSF